MKLKDIRHLHRELHSQHIQRIVEAVLDAEGDTQTSLRHAVEERAARLGGRPAGDAGEEVPADLADYVEKVAVHAYETTDADIENLRKAGYSEDSIFEITLSAAVGAGMARFERGMAIMTGQSL